MTSSAVKRVPSFLGKDGLSDATEKRRLCFRLRRVYSPSPTDEVPELPEPQPINPQEVADLSRELGRPIRQDQVPEVRRRQLAAKAVALLLAEQNDDGKKSAAPALDDLRAKSAKQN